MSNSRDITTYAEQEAVLDTALRLNSWPAEVHCTSPKGAVNWRAKAHTFRTLLRRLEEARLGLPRGEGTTLYDELTLTLDGATVLIAPPKPAQLIVDGRPVSAFADRGASAPDEAFEFVTDQEGGDGV